MAERSLALRRILEVVGLLMIGDGALAAMTPSRHVALWVEGPRTWRRLMRLFADRPVFTRAVGVAELAAGLWIARRQQPAA
jgi:hypothetical protein